MTQDGRLHLSTLGFSIAVYWLGNVRRKAREARKSSQVPPRRLIKLTAMKNYCKDKRASGGTLVRSYPGKGCCVAGRGLRENRGHAGGTPCLSIEIILQRLSHGSLCSDDCVDKIRICASKSALPALPMNTIFMQTQVKQRRKAHARVYFLMGKAILSYHG